MPPCRLLVLPAELRSIYLEACRIYWQITPFFLEQYWPTRNTHDTLLARLHNEGILDFIQHLEIFFYSNKFRSQSSLGVKMVDNKGVWHLIGHSEDSHLGGGRQRDWEFYLVVTPGTAAVGTYVQKVVKRADARARCVGLANGAGVDRNVLVVFQCMAVWMLGGSRVAKLLGGL